MYWPPPFDDGMSGMRGTKAYFKSMLLNFFAGVNFDAGSGGTYYMPLGYRIIFIRPRENSALLQAGPDAIAANLGVPGWWHGHFSPEFLQLFKVLKDRNYYVAHTSYNE